MILPEKLKKDIEGWAVRFLLGQFCRFGPLFVGNRISKEVEALNFLWREGYRYFHQTYKHENRVVWTSLFVPSELLFGMGLLPFSLEVSAALFAGVGKSAQGLMEADAQGVPIDVCSFHRSALGFAFKGYLPRPVIHAATSSLCDSNLKMIKICESITKKDTIVLDVPYELSGGAVQYLAGQLRNLVKRIEETSDLRMDPKRLREAIERANRTRQHMLEVNDVRVSPFSPLPGARALGFMLPSYLLSGSRISEEFYTKLAQELREKIKAKEESGLKPERKVRLLWLELKPYFKSNIPATVENNSDIKIAFEETNYVYWDELDPDRPYESLARKLITNHYNGPLERRITVLKKLARKYDVDGAVVFSQWGCRRNNAAVPIIKKELNREGFPVLNIDGDCVDNQNLAVGQTSTRFEGFIEMLRTGMREQKEALKT
ncbi:MAG: 2-hydroxyacyl-CoA dehydratase subunit D [Candidatus Brocadiales bacterium]